MKRIIGALLAFSMALMLYPAASAQGLSVGELKCDRIKIGGIDTGFGGNTLYADITYPGGASEESTKFEWMYSDSADGEYTLMPSEKKSTYTVSSEMLGRFVKLGVTAQGEETVYSEPIEITSIGPWGEYATGGLAQTPEENTFSIGGKTFILLDWTLDDKSTFFVMTRDSFGKMLFNENDVSERTQVFDAEEVGTAAYAINNDLLAGGIAEGTEKKKLPEDVTAHIDFNHAWVTEKGQPSAGYTGDTVGVYGVSLLSASDAVKYKDKYGYADKSFETHGNSYWLRTPLGAGVKDAYKKRVLAQSMWNLGKIGAVDIAGANNAQLAKIRPVFYLDKSFFLEKREKFTYMGENVLKMFTDIYSRDEAAAAGYSEDELNSMGYAQPPYCENVKILGNVRVNSLLKASYSFVDTTGAGEGETEILWLDAESGETLGSGEYFTPDESCEKKKIILSVTAADLSGEKGKAVLSGEYEVGSKGAFSVKSAACDCSGDSFEAEVLFDGEGKALCMLVVYGENEEILAAKALESQNGEQINIALDYSGEYKSAKLMVWDNIKDMNALLDFALER